jgi:cytochrome c biogenesis protein ResB
MLALFALMASLLIPRRRVWVRQLEDGTIELAALARGDDANLDGFLERVKQELEKKMTK